ncbi:HesB/YadR/YfhF [Tepidicaulis marinus]|uniref:HesB/YadR/YfhF n=2 Tax=Parvibaculaceae TaxID=2813035 RepID=A0A081B7I3_9HYPH|nr:HesB/YadR/YfhF [Tepidicaulis marinus]
MDQMSESMELELPGVGQPITLSERAAKQISKILSGEEPGVMLRIAVTGGGCSGFQYAFTFDDEKQDDDLVLERGGATVLIDELSQMYLGGSEIDYVDDLIGAAFKINNPNATANCGCGTSFSI